jgi:hypothetical protein
VPRWVRRGGQRLHISNRNSGGSVSPSWCKVLGMFAFQICYFRDLNCIVILFIEENEYQACLESLNNTLSIFQTFVFQGFK